MELVLQFTDLTCWEKTGHAVVSHEETMETAIAEYCPDMTRIVSACGQLYIREKTASEERATVSGTVRVTVLYTSEESAGLRSLAVSVPSPARRRTGSLPRRSSSGPQAACCWWRPRPLRPGSCMSASCQR